MVTEAQLKTRRDQKARLTLEQFAPVYIVSEVIDLEKPTILFNALFQHRAYGWVSRRYLYDGFNDVLYYKGQQRVSEDEAEAVQVAQAPWISATTADVPNGYGG